MPETLSQGAGRVKPRVALTLHLDGRLWSGDDELKTGLKAKGFDRFFAP